MKNKLGKLAINNLTIIIILGQIFTFLAISSGYITQSSLTLNYLLISQGEYWRVISFIFIPPSGAPLLSLLSWYILYLMGSNLEHYWGALHYNLYILLAVILTNIVSYIFKVPVRTNYYLQSSIFLAFAFLNGDFQVRLMFFIPVKIKWIAIATWIIYLWSFIFGNIVGRLLLTASLTNFFIFFGKDIYYKIRHRGKRIKHSISKEIKKNKPLHQCVVCSKNDITHPYMDFRYCSRCNPEQCYCEDHINNHTHIGE